MSEILITSATQPIHFDGLIQRTASYEQASLAANTRRTYGVFWKKFEQWCSENHLNPLPASAETVSLFLASLGGIVSFSSMDCIIAAIEKAHEKRGVKIIGEVDLYRRVRKGIRRQHKEKQACRQARALSLMDLTLACRSMNSSLMDARDKALITVAFFGALRRSELVSLDIEHLEFSEKGVLLKLLQSKTSDERVDIYLSKAKDSLVCPVVALQSLIRHGQLKQGSIFRSMIKGDKLSDNRLSGHAVAVIMKGRFGKEYSGHSLRRGVVTELASEGIKIPQIQKISRHKSIDMVLRYVESAEGFENTSSRFLEV